MRRKRIREAGRDLEKLERHWHFWLRAVARAVIPWILLDEANGREYTLETEQDSVRRTATWSPMTRVSFENQSLTRMSS